MGSTTGRGCVADPAAGVTSAGKGPGTREAARFGWVVTGGAGAGKPSAGRGAWEVARVLELWAGWKQESAN